MAIITMLHHARLSNQAAHTCETDRHAASTHHKYSTMSYLVLLALGNIGLDTHLAEQTLDERLTGHHAD